MFKRRYYALVFGLVFCTSAFGTTADLAGDWYPRTVMSIKEDGPFTGFGDMQDSLMLPGIVCVDCVCFFRGLNVQNDESSGAFRSERAGHNNHAAGE